MDQVLKIFQSFDYDGSRQLNFNEFKNCAFAQEENDETFLNIMREIRSRQEKKKAAAVAAAAAAAAAAAFGSRFGPEAGRL